MNVIIENGELKVKAKLDNQDHEEQIFTTDYEEKEKHQKIKLLNTYYKKVSN